MDERVDCVILGAGHNGLILQAYLAHAGLSTCAIERLAESGGPLVTELDPAAPGVVHNPHAVFLRGISSMPWFEDLDLAGQGVELIHPELNFCQIASDGRALRIYLDVERTCAAIAEFSPRDAATYRRLSDEFAPVVEHIVRVEAMAPPLPPPMRRALLERSAVGRLALATEPLSPRRFVERHFESPVLRAGLLYVCIIREVDVHAPGQGLLVPALIAGRQKAQLCRGGSARLARGLAAAVRARGGEIRTRRAATRILVEHGRAIGVELDDGSRLGSRVIASSLAPRHTFVELLGADCPPELARAAAGYRYNVVGPLCGVNVALTEPPRYRAAERYPDIDRAGLTILGLDGPQEIYALYEGRLAELGSIWGTTPTAHDPSQAPLGIHTAFMWQKVPYAPGGNPAAWDARRDDHTRSIVERWSRFAPNVTERIILSRRFLSPVDTERRFPNLVGGDLGAGWLGPGQAGSERPFPGAGGYRGGVPGLYLCGGATHPGGNITGLPGYNAARIICEDLGLAPWWNPPDPETLWAVLS
jgi:phytoene dehydrogenase-like protein